MLNFNESKAHTDTSVDNAGRPDTSRNASRKAEIVWIRGACENALHYYAGKNDILILIK